MSKVLSQEDKYLRTKRIILWLKVVGGILLIVILFSAIRGCQNARKQSDKVNELELAIDKFKNDTAILRADYRALKKEKEGIKEYADSLEGDKQKLESEKSVIETRNIALARRIQFLINNVPDTIDIIDKCKELADAYVNEYNISQRLKATNDSLVDALKNTVKKGVEIEANLNRQLDSALALIRKVEIALPVLKPTRNVKLGLSGTVSPFVVGGGPAGAYEDNRGNLFGANVSFTNKGNLYQGTWLRTISFKRK